MISHASRTTRRDINLNPLVQMSQVQLHSREALNYFGGRVQSARGVKEGAVGVCVES